MDFSSLLHVAQKNEKSTKNEIKYYSTKFEPPKKEERSKQLSSNIKKFLARKEAEEKQKSKEAKVKKEELLALRSQDKKATRRVSVMLKRTKSANKSVIQDAVDNDNTAVTLAGPSQPDEDDYGYVSQEASAYYNKMMAKYNNLPDEPKFSSLKKNTNVNLNGTKDRVRAALLKEQEEAMLPHRRKRRSKIREEEAGDGKDSPKSSESTSEAYYTDTSVQEKPAKPKPKVNAPPPLNFQELLKLAEKKQFEPIKIEPKKKNDDDEKPMTKRQKREFEKEKAWKEHREKRREAMENEETNKSDKSAMPPPNKIPKLNNGRIPKIGSEDPKKDSKNRVPDRKDIKPDMSKSSKLRAELEKPREASKPKPQTSQPYNQKSSISNGKIPEKTKEIPRTDIKKTELTKSRASLPSPKPKVPSKPLEGRLKSSEIASKSDGRSKPAEVRKLPPDVRPKQDSRKQFPPSDVRPKKFPPSDLRPKQFPPGDVRPKQFPPNDLRPKQFPPNDLRPKQFPPGDIRRKPPMKKQPMGHKRRILDDDDSEYDSEMDDFIDDGPDEEEDYSKYISEIFGYDKRKYRDIPEDDDRMESSFSQMMREEFISSKIGLMEDLEDMKQEAIEKKQKAARKKMSR